MVHDVTVGICVKNSEKYIGETIKSILKQDFPHKLLEIIVVDGGSVDNTISIVESETKRSDIETRVFFENQGLGVARQIIVENAKNEYILWVDGDMLLSQGFIRKLFDFANQHPKAGIVKGKQALERGANLLGTLEGYSRAASRMVDYNSEKGQVKTLGTAGALYRAVAIKQAGGFDKSIRGYGEDQDMEIRIRAAGWSLHAVDAFYLDYERLGLTWKDLWKRYWLRGYYSHYFNRKHKGMLKHYRLFPFAAFASGILSSITLYRLSRLKAVFCLPFQSLFKMTAWYVGYLERYRLFHREIS